MCRWVAYRGAQCFLEDLVTSPAHSLIDQSQCATEAKTATNGDGFGIAWYGERDEPGHYRDILPAWSDDNLRSLARQIASPLFLAHIRASTAGRTTRDNCHPFVHGRWSFMHNGQLSHFERLERVLEARLDDQLYSARKGSTDSELLFLLALEFGLEDHPKQALEAAIGFVISRAQALGLQPLIRFTAALSDGASLYCVRFATDKFAPTLYSGRMTGHAHDSYCLVSEPFDEDTHRWSEIPAGSFVSVTDAGIDVAPFRPAVSPRAIAV
ncbi:class II glutamine amidotransferase [Hoeflea prorocentri]|uniref:Class II glutamine amidotransferase n=1 Tax=Hoeflea prorocentri TaxID=1922333 RepID=A0A9X3UP52_9HYPH|nr:class II glutamine amidotransferase [Hoeflea prorocentri]MCY6382834.1 class II glutamine amidotransferase [Hoeflea prorocentri]MDA5400634.1 class II glutamine amidotransferase [Hoeflea prorocentri]